MRLFTWSETWKQKSTAEWGTQQLWGRVRSWYPKAPFNCNFILSNIIQNIFIEFLYQAYHSAGRWFYRCDCNSTLVLETGKWKWIILLIFTLWFKKSQDNCHLMLQWGLTKETWIHSGKHCDCFYWFYIQIESWSIIRGFQHAQLKGHLI